MIGLPDRGTSFPQDLWQIWNSLASMEVSAGRKKNVARRMQDISRILRDLS